jgi:penicillin-binding protein activator
MSRHFVQAAALAAAVSALSLGCLSLRRQSAYAPADEEGLATTGVDVHDYRIAVERLTASMLRHGLKTEEGQTPVIAFGPIENRSPYRVETRMIHEDVRIVVMKSGLARFTTATDFEKAGDESGALFQQLEFQNRSGHVRPDTAKAFGNIVGADYILFGQVYGFEQKGRDARGRRIREVNYRFTLTLTDVESGLAVWSDTVPIRKNIPR